MQLPRLGGIPGHPIIDPDKVDGYIQSIRGGNMVSTTGNDPEHSFVNAGREWGWVAG